MYGLIGSNGLDEHMRATISLTLWVKILTLLLSCLCIYQARYTFLWSNVYVSNYTYIPRSSITSGSATRKHLLHTYLSTYILACLPCLWLLGYFIRMRLLNQSISWKTTR
ncbi:hypothetical protein GGS21DRAFT_501246 [Xylaria nigripes]|nr:hypothetical protein GGS21DRAFT_501246 [Xylaria nigripes]